MECCVNALVTSFKETILAECPGMIKRNETDSEYCCTRPRPPTCRVHESGCAGVFVLCVTDCLLFLLAGAELHLMFSLMDKVPSGIEPMLKDLEDHIISAGLADMVAAAETITTVRAQTHTQLTHILMFSLYMWS